MMAAEVIKSGYMASVSEYTKTKAAILTENVMYAREL
jgi:hypothetical protein